MVVPCTSPTYRAGSGPNRPVAIFSNNQSNPTATLSGADHPSAQLDNKPNEEKNNHGQEESGQTKET